MSQRFSESSPVSREHLLHQLYFPAAINPVYRPPLRPEGRVWIENDEAASVVDLANTAYMLMLRLLGHAYSVPRPSPEKSLAVDLALGAMRAVTFLAERAARLPAGPSNPRCNAGVSFISLRDSAPLPPGPSARTFFVERMGELATAAAALAKDGDPRVVKASRILTDLARRATQGFEAAAAVTAPPPPATNGKAATQNDKPAAPPTTVVDGVEIVEGKKLTLMFETKRCIHARFCVTGAPDVFLANVQGPWIHPDAMNVHRLVRSADRWPAARARQPRDPQRHGSLRRSPPTSEALSMRRQQYQAVLRRQPPARGIQVGRIVDADGPDLLKAPRDPAVDRARACDGQDARLPR